MATDGKRGRRRHTPRPLQQGELDGLCGVYSIINAFRLLCPELDQAGAEHLFDHLIQCLPAITPRPSAAIAWGLWRSELRLLLRHATRYLDGEHNIEVAVSKLPDDGDAAETVDTVWNGVRRAVASGAVVIIGLGGTHCHWTVVTDATERQFTLFDSDRMSVLRRSQCRTASKSKWIALAHAEVFVLRRR